MFILPTMSKLATSTTSTFEKMKICAVLVVRKTLNDIVTKFAEKQYSQDRAKHAELRFSEENEFNGEYNLSAHLREIDWVRSDSELRFTGENDRSAHLRKTDKTQPMKTYRKYYDYCYWLKHWQNVTCDLKNWLDTNISGINISLVRHRLRTNIKQTTSSQFEHLNKFKQVFCENKKMYPNIKSLLQNEEGEQRDSVHSGSGGSNAGTDEPFLKANRGDNLEGLVNPVRKYQPGKNVREKCDKEKETEKEKNKFWIQVILLFAVIDILLIIVIALLFIPKRVESQRQTVVQWDDDVCFPCKDVYLTDDDKIDNIYNFDVREDGNLCCPGREKNLIDIVTKFAEKQYSQDRAKHPELRFNGENDHSAHLCDIDWARSEGQNKLHWKQASSFIGKSMTYKDGRIQVKTPGTCFIYAHLVFKTKQAQEDETFTHSIWLRNGENHEEKLLELFHSQDCLLPPRKVGFIPTHHGALFELKADDSIELRVQNINNLDKKKNKSIFGIDCFQ